MTTTPENVPAQLTVGWYKLVDYIILNTEKIKTSQGYNKTANYIDDRYIAYMSKFSEADVTKLSQKLTEICAAWYATTEWRTPMAYSSSFAKNGKIEIVTRNISTKIVKSYAITFSLYNANGKYFGRETQRTENVLPGGRSGFEAMGKDDYAYTSSVRDILISNVVFEN